MAKNKTIDTLVTQQTLGSQQCHIWVTTVTARQAVTAIYLGMFFRLVQGQHEIGLPLGGLEALFSHVNNNSCTTQVNLLSQWPVLETCTAQ